VYFLLNTNLAVIVSICVLEYDSFTMSVEWMYTRTRDKVLVSNWAALL
jgi:hypothetical protein